MKRSKLLAVFVLLASILFAISPWLVPSFDGFDSSQFPLPQVARPVQPAGYTFAIWGVIYLWLIVGSAYGLLKAADDEDWKEMRPPLLASLVLGVFWLPIATESPVWATVVIVFMAIFAIIAFLKAGDKAPLFQIWPVALYAGWLTAATGAGIGVTLGGYGVLAPDLAALVCISGVLLAALLVQSARIENWGYPAALVWALAGIIVANVPNSNWPVIGVVIAGITVILVRPIQSSLKGS
ncbi:hypothetical protein ACFE33_04685 [Falsihalocynthiibacter sp. SS001]|uniref:hypothetical protein n=1 Tax=Falsihalocynthiibacter sp. SS001 TaxID=3349698 RepID=UPI0036D37FBA